METTYTRGQIVAWAVGGFVGLMLLFTLLGTFTIVGAGQRGVVVRLGNVQDRILSEGIHLKAPWIEDVEKINVRTQAITYDNENGEKSDDEVDYLGALGAASRDLQDVSVSVVVNWRPHTDKVNKIYQQYKDGYVPTILQPIVRDTVKEITAQYVATDIVTKRGEIAGRIEAELKDKFAERDAVIESVQLTNISYSQSFNAAIEAKVRAEQEALTAKNQLETSKAQAEKRIAEARGEAEAIRIQAQAITQQGGDDYVKLKWIEKWNGQLPSTSLGSATPIIDLR